jgi:hypothetical protein
VELNVTGILALELPKAPPPETSTPSTAEPDTPPGTFTGTTITYGNAPGVAPPSNEHVTTDNAVSEHSELPGVVIPSGKRSTTLTGPLLDPPPTS